MPRLDPTLRDALARALPTDRVRRLACGGAEARTVDRVVVQLIPPGWHPIDRRVMARITAPTDPADAVPGRVVTGAVVVEGSASPTDPTPGLRAALTRAADALDDQAARARRHAQALREAAARLEGEG